MLSFYVFFTYQNLIFELIVECKSFLIEYKITQNLT